MRREPKSTQVPRRACPWAFCRNRERTQDDNSCVGSVKSTECSYRISVYAFGAARTERKSPKRSGQFRRLAPANTWV